MDSSDDEKSLRRYYGGSISSTTGSLDFADHEKSYADCAAAERNDSVATATSTTPLGPSADPDHASNPNLVRFTPDDPEKPTNWPALRRWLIVIAVSLMSMLSILATTTIVPAAPQVVAGFHISHNGNLYRTLLVTIWDLGEGVGPFFAAPLAERFGRAPIFHAGNLLGILCIVACALSSDIGMLVAFRFLGGCFFTAITLAPAIIGDVIRPQERGKAMAIGMGLRQIAPFAAPISGAYINQALGWRWIFWILAIIIAAVAGFAFLVVRETYAVEILRRKTKRLQRETGNPSLRSIHQSQEEADPVWKTVTRPVQILITSPAVFLVSLYTGVVCGIQFTVVTTLTPFLEEIYHFSKGTVGLCYIAACVGYIIGMLLYGLTSDRYLAYRQAKDGPDAPAKPENRLLHMLIGACALPCGLLLYGWTLNSHVHYIVPLIGTAIIALGMLLAVLPSENYLVDAYELHSASAVAACMIMRALFGSLFPLLGPSLYHKLGPGWGNSVYALIAAVFIPLLALLLRYGQKVRDWEEAHGVQRR